MPRRSDPALVVGAQTCRAEVPIMPPADAVRCAHRSMARSEAAHARHLRFDLVRRLAEVAAAAAALLRRRIVARRRGSCRHEFHWPNRVQKPTNTWVDNR